MLRQQCGKRTAAQTAAAVAHSFGHRMPCVIVGLWNEAARFRRPVSCSSMIIVSPAKDLSRPQLRTFGGVFDTAFGCQDASKRTAAWKSAESLAQCHVNRPPRLSVRTCDQTVFVMRPSSGLQLTIIRPLQNLADGVFGQHFAVTLPAMLGEQSSERTSRAQPAKALAQTTVDVGPLLVCCFPHLPAVLFRPFASPSVMGIRPIQDLTDVKNTAPHTAIQSTLTGLVFQARGGFRPRWPRRGPGRGWPPWPNNEKDARLVASGRATWHAVELGTLGCEFFLMPPGEFNLIVDGGADGSDGDRRAARPSLAFKSSNAA